MTAATTQTKIFDSPEAALKNATALLAKGEISKSEMSLRDLARWLNKAYLKQAANGR